MPVKKDLTSLKFGKLTVLKLSPTTVLNQHRKWECLCDCGNTVIVRGPKLVNGHTKSCGCYKVQRIKETHITHGETRKTVEYKTWLAIKQRCTNPNSKSYIWYGARGIQMCVRWLKSYESFLTDMGRRPEGHTIERKNVNKGYSPSNCIWASTKVQSRNRRNNVHVVYRGRTITLIEASELSGIKFGTLRRRAATGKTGDLLFAKVQNWGR